MIRANGEFIKFHESDVIFGKSKGSIVFREGKGTKRREFPLNVKVRKVLLDYLRMRPDVETNDLFLGQRNEGVQSKTICRVVKCFAKESVLKNVTSHTLWHSFAKVLIDAVVSIEKVAELLGHDSNLNTTQIYAMPSEQDLEVTIGKIKD
jgi:site-specific recombinase XerD